MALQVWLPLTKDLSNQGLADVVITNNGATFNNIAGKLGGCYYFTPNQWIKISIPEHMTTIKNITVAAWVKSHSNTLAFGGISHDSNASLAGISLYTNGWQLSGSGSSYKYIASGITANNQEWHHVACTIADDEIVTYVDGLKIFSTTLTAQGIVYTDITSNHFIEIGCDHPGGDEYFTGYVNDFRIYDHCLSPKEVKEISKGLVLHYPLNDKRSLTNLSKNATYSVYNNFSSSGTTGSIVKLNEKYQGCDVYRLTMTPDSTRVDSFKTTLHSHGIYGFRTTFKANTKYCFWIYYRPVTHSDIRVGGVASNIAGWTEIPPKKYNNEWYIVGQYRNGSVTSDKTDSIFTSFYTPTAAANVPISIDFCCPHLVEGSQEIIDDGDYQEIIDKTIIYDTSGHHYNGTITGTLTNSTDAPKYSVSINFTNNADTISPMACFSNDQTLTALTTSIWAKTNTMNSVAPNLISLGENKFWRFRIASATSIWYYIRVGTTQIANTLSVPSSITSTLLDNKWHLYTLVFDQGIAKFYIDSILIGTGDHTGTATYLTCGSTAWHLAGYTNNAENFIGSLSDFRIYATALSAEDIAELYHTAASVDNHGNVYAYEFEEV